MNNLISQLNSDNKKNNKKEINDLINQLNSNNKKNKKFNKKEMNDLINQLNSDNKKNNKKELNKLINQLNNSDKNKLNEILENEILLNTNNKKNKTDNKKIEYQKNNDLKNYTNKKTYKTKKEICNAISKHYVMRGNIIAAILSILPYKNRKTNRYESGFCHMRLNNLKNVNFCLPPDIENINTLQTDDKIKKVLNYINHLSKNRCSKFGGTFRTLTPTEKESLFTSNNQFNRMYIDYTKQLQKSYKSMLKELLNILKVLETSSEINNDNLEQISVKTKESLDTMYKMCQYNYLSAILCFLSADLKSYKSAINQTKKFADDLKKGLN